MVRSRVAAFIAAALIASAPAATQAQPADQDSAAFAEWLRSVRDEGLDHGISAATLDAALTGLRPHQRVIELDRHQPEFTQTFRQYLEKRVTPSRIETGRARLKAHRDLLERIGRGYGVQPRFIVALWGLETNFGRTTGGFSVIRSLATLAFDGRRSAYFRKELFNALKIIEEGHISVPEMMGSWAGAMGQNQFMPSSFLAYAVDHDGDGRRDIWGTPADVFASAANYLRRAGWRDDQTWGREVRLPSSFDEKVADLMPKSPPSGCRALGRLSEEKTLPEWQELGIRRADGGPLPHKPIAASLVLPEGRDGPAFLVYNNFRATLRWNCSVSFAASVGILADRLAGR